MSDVAIRANGLGKRYRIGARQASYRTLRETLVAIAATPAKRLARVLRGAVSTPPEETIWALEDVSFEVKQGEVLGVIGRNGAGKSTLLKILSRITKPTEGVVDIHGRVGSLLEVGTGFHPELTGRENIYLNGAILGMRRSEIARRFDEIVAFAEIDKFLDTPVKHYSSGMYVRLAFAVAAHLEPEILLVDEVLSVGDVEFQKKCLGKMDEVATGGRTVVLVSHNNAAVRKLCTNAILLDEGRITLEGRATLVLEEYVAGGVRGDWVANMPPPADGSAPGRLVSLMIEDGNGSAARAIPVGRPWQVRIEFAIERPVEHFMVALGLRTSEDVQLRTSWSKPRTLAPGHYHALFREEAIWLGTGHYFMNVGLSSNERTFHYVETAGLLEVSGVADGVDLVRVEGVGAVLNPMPVEIAQIDGPRE